MDKDEFLATMRSSWQESGLELGRFNLAVMGKTGVGKSTLINAIFGDEVAVTGVGRPVTIDSQFISHESQTFAFYDTRGVEVGPESDKVIADLHELVSGDRPVKERVHVVWYCVQATGSRFEAAESDFVNRVCSANVPVVLVMTKVSKRNGDVHPDAKKLAEEVRALKLPVVYSDVFPVMARADAFEGLDMHGLEELLDATFRVAPEGVRTALVAAQKIDMKKKERATNEAVALAVTAAVAAAATPIPLASSALLIPIQTGLMARIAQIYGVPMDMAVASALAATSASTAVGRTVAANVFKMIPGVGTLVGGAINATVAGTITTALAYSWEAICARHAKGEIDLGALPAAEINSMFKAGLSQKR